MSEHTATTADLPSSPTTVVSTILRHDARLTSYKLALLRAINDVVLAFPHAGVSGQDVAIPLRTLARFWIAYYWPFVDSSRPILQGTRSVRRGALTNDMRFRPHLTRLRQQWEAILRGLPRSSDGYFLVGEMQVHRKRQSYPRELLDAYEQAIDAIVRALKQPIHYAGPGEWTVFAKPRCFSRLDNSAVAIPGTEPNDECLVVRADLWATFTTLSLWIEALAVHEWCLFTDSLTTRATIPRVQPSTSEAPEFVPMDRGEVYRLLTDRPENRRPLTWERHQIDGLLASGTQLICPWTERPIRTPGDYDLDHLVPVAVYPINELWNLMPTNPRFNTQVKRDRLPTWHRLARAEPWFASTYARYLEVNPLAQALADDAAIRFGAVLSDRDSLRSLAAAVVRYIDQVAESRSLARFD